MGAGEELGAADPAEHGGGLRDVEASVPGTRKHRRRKFGGRKEKTAAMFEGETT